MIQKIYRNIFFIAFITLLCCFVTVIGIFYSHSIEGVKLELKEKAAFAAEGAEIMGEEYLLSLQVDVMLTWYDKDGNILYDNQGTSDQVLLNLLSYAEDTAQAVTDGEGYAVYFSDKLSRNVIYYSLRLSDGSILRLSDIQHTVWEIMLPMVGPAVLLLLLIFLLSVVISRTLSRKITAQLNSIDPENPLGSKSFDELSPLLGRIERQNRLIRRQMADLKSRQEEFHAITENMSEGFILMDRHYNLLSYNSAAAKVFSLDRAESPSIEASPAIKKLASKVLKGEHLEERISLNNRVYQLFANPVYNEERVNGLVIVALDITEKEQQEQIRREFTSNVSHELKTPLTTIYGVSEMIMSGIVRDEDIKKFAANIHDETGRMITLVNDILRLSQLDENAISQEREPTDLFAISQDVVRELSGIAKASGIALTLTGESAVVEGIPAILHEMIYNLCDNAIKYNKENGSVKVSVKTDNGTIAVSIADTGIGIPAEHIDRVFERFYRVDKSHSRQNGGTGLGLSIVKHAAAYHNARVQMESRVGEGTVVTILLKEMSNLNES